MTDTTKPQTEEAVLITLEDIDATHRLRPSDPAVVEGIAASMRRAGQLQAIDVCRLVNQSSGKPYRLVFGGHRFDAAALNGWTHIKAVVRSNDAMERREREIAENFFRADLAPLDQARFVAELIALEKVRLGIGDDQDGRALNADVRSEKAKKKQLHDDLCSVHKSFGIQEAVASRLGLSQSTVSRQLPLAQMSPGVIERVRRLVIADNAGQLRQLAGLHSSRQHVVLDYIEEGKAKRVSDAIAILDKKVQPTAEQKRASAFIGAFKRMAASERRAQLRELVEQMTLGEKDLMVTLASATFKEAAE